EEIVGLAYDYDAPGARAPQAIIVAVPPNVERGWRREDVHAVVEETLALARVRALTLSDLPDRLAGVVASLMPTLPLPPEA
ncbi:MAG: hypothetical protein M3N47_13965, partial [Chloroflexota bacterium]|nr:hypothetical protein [Chloroflexota bacterium]